MLSFVFMRAHTVYIYIPLHLHSRSFIPNVHTLFCPLAHLALRQVHLCSAMGGTNACNMVLTLAVLLMSRQVFVEVHVCSFIFYFLFLIEGLIIFSVKKGGTESQSFFAGNCAPLLHWLEWKHWQKQRLQRRQQVQRKYSAPNKLAANLTTQHLLESTHLQMSSDIFYVCVLYITADAQRLQAEWVRRNTLMGNCVHTVRLCFPVKCRTSQ